MSKFDKIFEARETSEKEQSSVNKTQSNTGSKKKSGKPEKTKSVPAPVITNHQEPPTPQKPRGRPKAKRSDPNYVGFTTYIRKSTHLKVKIALLQEGNGQELSELVETLLTNWAKNR